MRRGGGHRHQWRAFASSWRSVRAGTALLLATALRVAVCACSTRCGSGPAWQRHKGIITRIGNLGRAMIGRLSRIVQAVRGLGGERRRVQVWQRASGTSVGWMSSAASGAWEISSLRRVETRQSRAGTSSTLRPRSGAAAHGGRSGRRSASGARGVIIGVWIFLARQGGLPEGSKQSDDQRARCSSWPMPQAELDDCCSGCRPSRLRMDQAIPPPVRRSRRS